MNTDKISSERLERRAGTYLQIRVGRRPAAVTHPAPYAVVDEDVVVADERHDELPLRLERDCRGDEEPIEHPRTDRMVRHFGELVDAECLDALCEGSEGHPDMLSAVISPVDNGVIVRGRELEHSL